MLGKPNLHLSQNGYGDDEDDDDGDEGPLVFVKVFWAFTSPKAQTNPITESTGRRINGFRVPDNTIAQKSILT